MSKHRLEYEMKGKPIDKITLENICGTNTSPVISYWAPRREEIQRFVEIAKAVHAGSGKPKILDVGCGAGFLAYLLAETGEVEVIGLDPRAESINDSPYSHPNLRLEVGDSTDAVNRYGGQDIAMVISSWMPYQLNLTPDIRNIGAKSIAYVTDSSGATGVNEYEYKKFVYDKGFDADSEDAEAHRRPNPVGKEDGISFEPGKNYIRTYEWTGPAFSEINDIARIIMGDKDGIIWDRNRNAIDIQIRKGIVIPKIPVIRIDGSQKYPWEKDLEHFKGELDEMERYESRNLFLLD